MDDSQVITENSPLTGERLSENYYKRKYFLKSDSPVPTQKQIRQNLDNTLTDYYFSIMPKDSRKIIGLEPLLDGPGDQLWVTPSGELNGDIKLKPVTTQEIKALTHQGILDIGGKTLGKFEYEKELGIEKAILDNDEVWKWLAKEHCRRCVKKAIRKERAIQDGDAKRMINVYNDSYKGAVNQVQTQYNLKLEERLEEMKAKLQGMYRLQGEVALMEMSKQLQADFEDKISKETTKLKEHFEQVIELEQARFAHEMSSRTRDLRHQLECRGIVDVLYTACAERHHYLIKQNKIEKEYGDQIEELKNALEMYQAQLQETESQLNHNKCVDRKLQENMRRLCKEFRKLFSYHTNLPPSQLGFLPNLEEMFIESALCEKEEISTIQEELEEGSEEMDMEEEEHEEEEEYEDKEESEKEEEGIIFIPAKSEKLPIAGDRPFIIYGDMSDKIGLSKSTYGCDEVIESSAYLPKWLIDAKAGEVARTSLRKSFEPSSQDSSFMARASLPVLNQQPSAESSSAQEFSALLLSFIEKGAYRTSILKKRATIEARDSLELPLSDGEIPQDVVQDDKIIQDVVQNNKITPTEVAQSGSQNMEVVFPDKVVQKAEVISEDAPQRTEIVEERPMLHRDSLILQKDSLMKTKHSILDIIKVCPVPTCKFKSILGFDMPPHLLHLATASYDEAQTFSYDNYEKCAKDELSQLTQLFKNKEDTLKSEVFPREEEYSDAGIVRSEEKDLKCTCHLKGGISSDKDKGDEENVKPSSKMSVSSKEKVQKFKLVGEDERASHLKLKPKCFTNHTLESVKQIFEDHPSFAECFLDQGIF